ncbi:MAG: MerR family transcriptional regulator [Ruminococcus sp.]
MACNFQIGEISHFFDIPASTLRYWEEMGVLTPAKDRSNNYREYTIEDLMSISDVIFYKNLGLPLKTIRQMESTTPQQHYHLFEKKLSELQQQQLELQQRMEKLRCHMEAIQTLNELRNNPYQETDIDTDCIVSFELIEREKLRRYIENPYLYSRVQHSENMQTEQRGITISSSDRSIELKKGQIIWEKNSDRYITFLMKEEITNGFPNDLQGHLQLIQQKYQTGAVISRFLVCAQEEGKIFDFYKTFVEII